MREVWANAWWNHLEYTSLSDQHLDTSNFRNALCKLDLNKAGEIASILSGTSP